MIYLLTAIGLTPGGSSTVHIYTQTVHRTTELIWKSAGRAPYLRVIPWHLLYNWGKRAEKPYHARKIIGLCTEKYVKYSFTHSYILQSDYLTDKCYSHFLCQYKLASCRSEAKNCGKQRCEWFNSQLYPLRVLAMSKEELKCLYEEAYAILFWVR